MMWPQFPYSRSQCRSPGTDRGTRLCRRADGTSCPCSYQQGNLLQRGRTPGWYPYCTAEKDEHKVEVTENFQGSTVAWELFQKH